MDRYRSPAHRHLSVVKDPALASWLAAEARTHPLPNVTRPDCLLEGTRSL